MYNGDVEIDQATSLSKVYKEHKTVMNCCFVTRHGAFKLKPNDLHQKVSYGGHDKCCDDTRRNAILQEVDVG